MKKASTGKGWPTRSQAQNRNQVPAQTKSGRSFEKACAEIQASLDRFNFTDELSDEASEEEQEKDKVLDKVLQSYQDEGRNIERTREFLEELLTSGGIICLICIETIKKVEAIWSCRSCYGLFHLPCIQKWATDTIQHQQAATETNLIKSKIFWCCPKCRSEYGSEEKPQSYVCFCGKVKDPTFDPWLVSHSCGQVCNKRLSKCLHVCLLLCHPGPCPPCAQTVRSSCHCGGQEPTTRRCSNKEWSCGQECSRRLSCSQHSCTQLCHSGHCQPCQKQSNQPCSCGQESKLRPCNEAQWDCQQACGKAYSCGHHFCQKICHNGLCGSCPREGLRSCPCGKTKFELPCMEEVTLCGDTCDKVLACKIHNCAQRCHFGPCSQCLQVRVKHCRCGAKERNLPCSKDFICDTKCKNFRDCRKHFCNRKCCEGDCPPCEQICGRSLPCKNHKCNSQCHIGPCYPCPLRVSVTCNCGQTKVSVPCGRERLTKPPRCKEKCSIPSDCHHPVRSLHRCHFEECPSCNQICGQLLDPCLHPCPSKCHDRVKMKPEHKRAGPWEPVPATTIETLPCPPCLVPMPLQCLGKHTVHEFACSELKPWSCGRPCGFPLSCTNHRCSLECHDGPVHSECLEACSRTRHCSHPCSLPCHPDSCPPCHVTARKACHCNLTKLYILCYQLVPDDEDALLSCQNRCSKLLECGHRCPFICHAGKCANVITCKRKVSSRCPCKRLKLEFPCNTKRDIVCDSDCQRIQWERLEEKERKRLEEQEAAPIENCQPRQKSKRKQRDRRNRGDCLEDKESKPNYVLMIIVTGSIGVALLAFFAYLLNK